MYRNVCALRMMHICYRWIRPCRATRSGTQAPTLSSLHQTSLPRNLPQFSSSANTSPPTIPRVCLSAEPLPTGMQQGVVANVARLAI
ncbi:hypothetical protein [Segatella oulorum]|uniref:hypothetical protein n=1 Tax=Segatella oulorum TaxID=28136 RepID=UPI0012DF49BD|nr:hypothetical protein [Segatella oulorum]